jgi:hypothetical protein
MITGVYYPVGKKSKVSYFPENVIHILILVIVCRKIDSDV